MLCVSAWRLAADVLMKRTRAAEQVWRIFRIDRGINEYNIVTEKADKWKRFQAR